MGRYVITGIASGIGAALASQLKSDGHEVIGVDLKDAAVEADLSTEEGRRAAVAALQPHVADGVDGFVPLAGVAAGSGHDPKLITALNYFGTLALVEALKDAVARRRGSIVLVSSNSAAMAPHEFPLIEALLSGDEAHALEVTAEQGMGLEYMAGKRALAYWMRRNAMSYARAGVRINAVAPGPIDTPMTQRLFDSADMKAAVDGLLGMTPIDRLGQADEVAKAIRFLLSSDAAYICGSVLFVDGGYDAATRSDHL